MMLFFRKTLHFFALYLLFNIIFLFLIAKPLLYNEYIIPKNKLNNFDTFLFADSHGYAIGREILENNKICNFSYDSDSYIDIYAKILFLLNNNIIPKQILISVDDHTLSPYREKLNNNHRSIHFAKFSEIKDFSYYSKFNFYLKKYVYFYFPLLDTNNAKLFTNYISQLIRGDKKNKTTQWVDILDKKKFCNVKFESQFSYNQKSIQLKKALDKIIEVCKLNDIDLIGIKFPLSRNYIECINNMSYKADSIVYSNNYRIIDYKNLYVNHDEFFRDQDHINEKGRNRLIDQIIKDIKQ